MRRAARWLLRLSAADERGSQATRRFRLSWRSALHRRLRPLLAMPAPRWRLRLMRPLRRWMARNHFRLLMPLPTPPKTPLALKPWAVDRCCTAP